jgi:hypothetical protein
MDMLNCHFIRDEMDVVFLFMSEAIGTFIAKLKGELAFGVRQLGVVSNPSSSVP